MSGLEENPGPAQHTLEDHPVEDWEFAEVVTEMDDLKTKRTKFAVCAVGDLRPDLRSEQSMIVYTRNGPRRVKHVPMRCNNRNPECRAYHGYGFSSSSIWNSASDMVLKITRLLKTLIWTKQS